MFLKSQNISLRPLTRQDLSQDYVNWLNDQDTCSQNSHAYFPYTMDNLIQFYESGLNNTKELRLAIQENENSSHIGNISLQNINYLNRSAELAILLGDKNYWGRGLGYEASLLIIRHGFYQLNLHRIYCGTTEENIGMRKVAEKIGMTQEGVRRDAFFKNGKYQNIIEFGILKNEFLE